MTPGTPDADRRARLMRKGGKPTEEERLKTTRDRGWVFWDGKHGFFFPIQGQGLGKKLVDGGLIWF